MTVPEIKRRARGLDRAFEILEYLKTQRQPLRPHDIAKGINAPKSTVYELVALLLARRILESVGHDGLVYLGRELYFLGQAHLSHFDFTRESDRFLQQIVERTHETAQMCLLNGRKYNVALMREGERAFRISSGVGEDIPIPWTASGRLLLGHMSDEAILELVPTEDFTLPDGSRLSTEQFLQEIRQAHRDGFFSFDSIADTYTHCFAAGIYNSQHQCTATFCIVAPRGDAYINHDRYRSVLMECARAMEQRLAGKQNR
ncbi:IclR family transcriptional regulator [Pectobacterium cacticida]|uniref:IclR family transcriptional regulator n=1 Tax=Pectobacterium cacticida TaxID=69221 RepID=A0ABZ2G7U6_9GAMM|nr:IclR family transcriptional regulator [Pectobacterium cacticida]UYX07761.1 IclR family transcriptional regulator [Pectobacterium cacticida]